MNTQKKQKCQGPDSDWWRARLVGALAITLSVIVLTTSPARSDSLLDDMNSLGGNNVLLERARKLNPDTKVEIVQNRIVDRRVRFEIAPEYSNVFGGDAYNQTQNMGLNTHFHFTPQWSVGLKYNYSVNSLRAEGEHLIRDTSATGKGVIPDIDYPKEQALLLLNWYPIYGKMNLYDLGVAHFDIYAILGGGQLELKSGKTNTYTGGAGIGFWISQNLSTRFELRYQTYEAKRKVETVRMNTTVGSIQIGYIL